MVGAGAFDDGVGYDDDDAAVVAVAAGVRRMSWMKAPVEALGLGCLAQHFGASVVARGPLCPAWYDRETVRS